MRQRETIAIIDDVGTRNRVPTISRCHGRLAPASKGRIVPVSTPPTDRDLPQSGDGRPLIFCGMCGALNPAGNHYCAACGTTLVDAFHATEGLRVYERADSASRLVEIVPAGTELDMVEEKEPHSDYVRVRIESGKLGYIRMSDVAAMYENIPAGPPSPLGTPDINTNARGCVTPVGALGAMALVLVLVALFFVVLQKSDTYDQGTMLILGCFGLGPLLVVTIALYLYARSRDDRLEEEAEEAMLEAEAAETAARGTDKE